MVAAEKSPLLGYQRLMEEKLSADMEFARSLVGHSGERGRLVELVLKKVLERHLPEAFGVSTGFAIDHHGASSKQLDLIIYGKAKCPFFFDEGVSVVPVEAVIGAIEVKTKLDRLAFEDTREKARSLLELDRSAYVHQPNTIRGPFSDQQGRQIPLFLGVSLTSVDTEGLLNNLSGEVIEPVFLSMDGMCLMNSVLPDKSVSWTYRVDYPAAMFVLLASMLTSQSRMMPIDVTKYMKVNPAQ